ACSGQRDGTPCGTDCTEKGTCRAGACVGALPIADGTPCPSPAFCTANTVCLEGICQGGTPQAAGTPCQTGNICTLADHCNGMGACVAGDEIDCDDSNPVTTDFCDPNAGCVHSTASTANSPSAGQTIGHYEGGVGACSFVRTDESVGSSLLLALVALLAFSS